MYIYSLIEECLNFDSCQREVKVKSKSEKSLKGKHKNDKAAEDSRIDFQLTWNKRNDVPTPVTDSSNKSKEDLLDPKIEVDFIETCEDIKMLLEVKSVTLAMSLPGEKKVRNSRIIAAISTIINAMLCFAV